MTDAGEDRPDKGWRYFKTIALSCAFFVLGLCIALLGPALPTLAANLGTTVDSLAFLLTSRGCGYLFGSLLCAYLFRFVNQYLVVACSLLMTGIGNFIVPLAGHYVLLAIVVIAAGMSMGVLDTGGNVMCLALWGGDSESWIQLLHFSFAFGATMSPLLAQPFIREVDETNKTEEVTGATVSEATAYEVNGFPTVAWAFTIAASSCFIVALMFCYLWCSKDTLTESRQEDTTAEEGKAYRLKVLALLFLFYFLYVGAEVAFGLFIYYFAINCDKHYSKDTGTLMNTLFWGAFAVGRFFAIFFAKCMTPRSRCSPLFVVWKITTFYFMTAMLILDLIGTTISTLVMVLFPLVPDDMEWTLWGAVGLYGWSMASLFPSGITWAEQYITVTGTAATSFVVGAALGEMVIPFTMSYLVVKDPMNLMYYSHASSWMCIFIFVCLTIITSKRGSRLKMSRAGSKSEMQDVQTYDAVPTSDTEMM